MSLVLLLLLSSSSLTTSPQAQASLLSSLASSSITYNYYGPGIFGATLPNGTTFENFSNPPQLADINISFSVSQSKLNASFQYTLTNHSPIKGTLDLRVDPSTLRLTQDNMSLGYFYLWLPQRYANGSVINNFLTVVDTLNETYNLDGHVLDKQGLDYVIASSETPFVNVINVYNASTGAAVSLMIPGLFPFSVRQVESGNFTEGHKDIGHTPLGVLLDLDWTNFEPGPSGFLVASNHASIVSQLLSVIVPQMSGNGSNNTQVAPNGGSSVPVSYLVIAAVLAIAVFVGVLGWNSSRSRKHGVLKQRNNHDLQRKRQVLLRV